MGKKIRTEITIETDRTFLIRARKNIPQAWCAKCRETSGVVPVEEIGKLTGLSARTIYSAVEAGEAHFIETIEGLLLVCLKSLSIADKNTLLKLVKVDSPESKPFLEL